MYVAQESHQQKNVVWHALGRSRGSLLLGIPDCTILLLMMEGNKCKGNCEWDLCT